MTIFKTPCQTSRQNPLQHIFKKNILLLCVSIVISPTPLSASVLVIPGQNLTDILGRGFIDETKTLTSRCMQGKVQLQLAEESRIKFSMGDEAEQALASLSGKLKGSVNLFVAGASASTQFVETKNNDKNGISIISDITYTKYKAKLSNLTLNDLGLGTISRPSDIFLTNCGSSVAAEASVGARLSVVARLVYVGSRTYKYRKTKAKAEFLGATVAKKSKVSESDEIAREFVLNIDAFQEGGNTETLNAIISNGQRYCSLAEPLKCTEMYRDLISYSQNGFKESVINVPIEKLSALNITTEKYQDLSTGITFPEFTWKNSPLTFKNTAITSYRKQLADILEEKEIIEAKLFSGVTGQESPSDLKAKIDAKNIKILEITDRINACDFSGPDQTYLCEF